MRVVTDVVPVMGLEPVCMKRLNAVAAEKNED